MKIPKTQRKLVTNFNDGYYGLLVQEIDERYNDFHSNMLISTKISFDMENIEPWKRYVVNYNPEYFISSLHDEDAEKLVDMLSKKLGAKKIAEILIKAYTSKMEEFHGPI